VSRGVARRDAPSFSSRWLAGRLRTLIGPLRGARLCVAFSGGADSTALLAALAMLARLRPALKLRIRAVHVNHQLQSAAAAMARAAGRTARALKVPCVLMSAPVRAQPGESVEAAARATRYAALQGQLRRGEWLVLAQHRDDQLETVLLQLLRGAGVAGLSAMPERAGMLLRPLLPVSRASLRAFARRQGVPWWEDPSNEDERFDRNYLRQEVLPALTARWPAAAVTVARSAGLAAEAQQLLETLADEALGPAQEGWALQVPVLRRLAPAASRNVLRRWLVLRGVGLPDQRRLQELAGPVLRARHDAQPQVSWPGAMVRRHGSLLYAWPLPLAEARARVPGGGGRLTDAPRADARQAGARPVGAPRAGARLAEAPWAQWDWTRQPSMSLPGGAGLQMRRSRYGSLDLATFPQRLTVRFRSGGERLEVPTGHQSLKNWLQECGLPPWLRAQVPLLYAGERLVAVADWWWAPEFAANVGVAPAKAPPVGRLGPKGGPSGAGRGRGRLVWRPPAGQQSI